jgi:hypothetical protein
MRRLLLSPTFCDHRRNVCFKVLASFLLRGLRAEKLLFSAIFKPSLVKTAQPTLKKQQLH